MSASRWLITPSWLSWSLISFLYNYSVYFPTLLNIFCEVHTISVLYCAHLCMKFSFGISHFLEDLSSLSHSIVFLYFFALITEEGFLISPWYSLELCIMVISFLVSFAFSFSSFHSYLPPLATILPLFVSCSWGWFWSLPLVQMPWTSIHSSSGTLSDLIPWIDLSLPQYSHKDLI